MNKGMKVVVFIMQCLLVFPPVSAQKEKKKKKDPPAPTIQKLSVDVPSLAALEGTAQSQTKGDVRITVTQEIFRSEGTLRTDQRQVQPSGWLVFAPGCQNGAAPMYVERTQIPQLNVVPDRLVFHVHINNQMSHVFRGSGLVVQFNVAGKVVSVDPSGYGDLVNVIIPPRGEQEISVIGPPVSQIPSPSTVGLFLYDVVTKVDQAGNTGEKQNYEWFFSYQTQAKETEFTVAAPQQGWLCP